MLFFDAIGGIFSILCVVALGYVLAARGWITPEIRERLPKFITIVCLPLFLMSTMSANMGREGMLTTFNGIAVPFLGLGGMFLLAVLVARLCRVQQERRGLFCAAWAISNTVYIGFPVNQALFGNEGLVYAILYYCANTLFYWSIGDYAVSSDNPEFAGHSLASRLARALKHLWTPPIWGLLMGLLLVFTPLQLPRMVMMPCTLVGAMTTPLALIFIGATLQTADLRLRSLEKDVLLVVLGRLVVCPLVMILLVRLFDLPEVMGKVFVVQTSLPIMAQIAIMSAYYRTDTKFGALTVSLTTVLSAITMPIIVSLL